MYTFVDEQFISKSKNVTSKKLFFFSTFAFCAVFFNQRIVFCTWFSKRAFYENSIYGLSFGLSIYLCYNDFYFWFLSFGLFTILKSACSYRSSFLLFLRKKDVFDFAFLSFGNYNSAFCFIYSLRIFCRSCS